MTLEELLALACLFGVPVLEFLLPDHGDHIAAPTLDPVRVRRVFSEETVRELFVGEGGKVGSGGLDWGAAHDSLVGYKIEDWRPAVELWRTRREEGKA